MKWSHFQDEKGNKHKQAYIDGYDIRDKLLEGIPILITIENDGSLSAKFKHEDSDYVNNFNIEKLLKEAVEFAETSDIFFGLKDTTEENDDIMLVAEDGRTSDEIASVGKPEPKAFGITLGKDLKL